MKEIVYSLEVVLKILTERMALKVDGSGLEVPLDRTA